DEIVEVQTQPREPGKESAELQLADLAHRAEPGNRRHAAFVEVLERRSRRWVFALEAGLDLLRCVDGALDRALRLTGHARHAHQVSDDEDVRIALHGEVRFDDHAACSAICLPSGLACTPADQTLTAQSMRCSVPSFSLTVRPM